MDRDALPEKENLRHAGDDEQNAETLRSEVTGLIAQVPVDSSSSLKSRERTDALNSSHRINPEVEQTEADQAQQGTEERDATPPVDDDLGPFISDVAMQPICTTGRLGDLFIGSHKVVGKIALKRIRVGDTQAEAEALRFIENGNVLKYIGKHPDVNRVRLLCETSEAIDYLHRQTIVHGDIKASNILVGVDGHVLLCDVGLAGMLPAQISLSWKGVGTFRWQSPELWDDDDGTRTFASDVYAFSMTIAEVMVLETFVVLSEF
ncbi:hypothetical protein FRC01_007096 [Tulasnella sp. 417]|nr:hypothetical protein FRC01_007096 [Tulasnella sp. 417]